MTAPTCNSRNSAPRPTGVAQRLVNAQPLTNPAADAQGRTTYRLRTVNGRLMTGSFESAASIFDVYRIQISVKYSFN